MHRSFGDLLIEGQGLCLEESCWKRYFRKGSNSLRQCPPSKLLQLLGLGLRLSSYVVAQIPYPELAGRVLPLLVTYKYLNSHFEECTELVYILDNKYRIKYTVNMTVHPSRAFYLNNGGRYHKKSDPFLSVRGCSVHTPHALSGIVHRDDCLCHPSKWGWFCL